MFKKWNIARRLPVRLCLAVMIGAPGSLQAGHLTGDLPRDVERSGVGAVAEGIEQVSCMDCHVPHAAMGTALLRTQARESQACLECHTGVDPARRTYSHPVGEEVEGGGTKRILREETAGLFAD